MLVVTQAGLDKAVQAGISGISLIITHVAIGANGYEPNKYMTALKNETVRKQLTGGKNVTPNQLQIQALFDDQGVEIIGREIGFFLDDGTLFAIDSHPADIITYKSASNGSKALETFDLILDSVPPNSVTVSILGDMTIHEEDQNPHPQYAPFDSGRELLYNTDHTISPVNQRLFDGNWAALALDVFGLDGWIKFDSTHKGQSIEAGEYSPSTAHLVQYRDDSYNLITAIVTSPSDGHWGVAVPFNADQISVRKSGVALPYQFEAEGEKLAKCQRHYFKLSTEGSRYAPICPVIMHTFESMLGVITLPVTMREIPVVTHSSDSHFRFVDGQTAVFESVSAYGYQSKSAIAVGVTASGLTSGDSSLLTFAEQDGWIAAHALLRIADCTWSII